MLNRGMRIVFALLKIHDIFALTKTQAYGHIPKSITLAITVSKVNKRDCAYQKRPYITKERSHSLQYQGRHFLEARHIFALEPVGHRYMSFYF